MAVYKDRQTGEQQFLYMFDSQNVIFLNFFFAKYSKHLINRVLHGAPIIEVIFLREEKPVLALLMLSAKQGSHWYHF